MSGENRQRRNAFALAISTAAHLVFLGLVINTSSIPYDLPLPPPAPEPPSPAMEVEIVRLPTPIPPKAEATPQPSPAAPPVNWPKPERMRVLPPLPPSATPAPTPAPTPQPAAAKTPPPLAAAPPAPTPTPAPLRKLTLAQRKLIEAAAQAASAAPVARAAPLGALNIHIPALAPPAGVPTLPLAGTPGAGRPNLAGTAGGARAGGAGGQRGVGLSPFPYGYLPSGGSGLRGTLVGCANAEAVRLSAAERDRCAERFGVEIGAAPKLDPIAGSRAGFDKAAAREERERKYRASTTDLNHDPSLPGGIAAGPASTETFKHNPGDPK